MLSVAMNQASAQAFEPSIAREPIEESRGVLPPSISILIALVEEFDRGMMLLDPVTHRLLHANRLGLQETRSGGTLQLEQGRIHARNAGCRPALEKALALVGSDRRSMVSLSGERSTCTVAIAPLSDQCSPQLALLMFGKHAACESLSVGFYARLHGLTPCEETVLKALCRGLRPAGIAGETGVKISTVRAQISSIRMKTRTGSIHELVRTMSGLPPINQALRMAHPLN